MAGVVKKDRACAMACGERVPKVGPRTCGRCRAVLAEISADQKRAKQQKPGRANVGAAYTRGRQMSSVMRTYGR